LAKELVKKGADVINVSYGGEYCYDLASPIAPYTAQLSADFPMGMRANFSQELKKHIPIPVMAVGRINRPIVAEKILSEGKADLIGMARQMIADPYWVDKARKGHDDEIRTCLSCQHCLDLMMHFIPVECASNAFAGKEAERRIIPVEKTKKVVVIGGGPAGMEAARVAALRGHKVILYDKAYHLGGLSYLAALVHTGLELLTPYYKAHFKKLGVDLKLKQEANLAMIKKDNPDVLILASGGKRVIPKIPGIDGDNVLLAKDIQGMMSGRQSWRDLRKHSIWQRTLWYAGGICMRFLEPPALRKLTKLWIPFGKKVIIVGGDIPGGQLAEFLAKRGRKVTVVETSTSPAVHMEYPTTQGLLHRLAEQDVSLLTAVKEYVEITDKGLSIINAQGKPQTIEANTVVVIGEIQPDDEFYETVRGIVPEVYRVGDCAEYGQIVGAVHGGAQIGCEV
jgi:2,4-dienoyl-CoA reductase (NADPH2)